MTAIVDSKMLEDNWNNHDNMDIAEIEMCHNILEQ